MSRWPFHSHLWPGVPFALGSAALFGASTPLSKLLLGEINPWLLAGILYLGAGLGLALMHFSRPLLRLAPAEAQITRSDLPWLALIVLSGGILGPVLLMFGLSLSSGAAASLLLNLEGLATMVIAWIIFRENVDARLLIGAGSILAGAALLTLGHGGFELEPGGLLVAGACVAWGVDNNLTRKLSTSDPVQIAMIKGLAAGAVNLVLALMTGAEMASPALLAAGAVLGFFGIGVSLVLFIAAMRHLGSARTGAYYSMAPFAGASLALILFSEPVSAVLVASAVLMALGLWLHLAERHDHEHIHDELEHEHAHFHDAHHQHPHDGPAGEPHSHRHRHEAARHRHPHYPDAHHRHRHS